MKKLTQNNFIKINKPWGYEKLWAHTPQYAAKFIFIKKHSRLSYQYHQLKDETILVMDGMLKLTLDEGEELLLGPTQSFHIKAGRKHRFEALKQNCTLIEVSTPELNDVIRLHDDYGRIQYNRKEVINRPTVIKNNKPTQS